MGFGLGMGRCEDSGGELVSVRGSGKVGRVYEH
jgi:hypothetical protein